MQPSFRTFKIRRNLGYCCSCPSSSDCFVTATKGMEPCSGEDLRVVKPSLKAWPFSNSSISTIGTEEIVVTWLRIGHTRSTQGHLRGETWSVCNPCGLVHILQGRPRHDTDHQSLHLHGKLRYIVEDDRRNASIETCNRS